MSKAKDKQLKLIVDNSEEEKTSRWEPNTPLPGSKDPTDDWLSRIPEGTIFACKDRRDTGALLVDYEVLFKYEKCIRLFNPKLGDLIVLSKPFSQRMEMVEILTKVQQEQQEEE